MWTYRPEDPAPDSVACLIADPSRLGYVSFSVAPDDDQGAVLAEALNVHEATGLTPAQLQARVAELETKVRELEAKAMAEAYRYG